MNFSNHNMINMLDFYVHIAYVYLFSINSCFLQHCKLVKWGSPSWQKSGFRFSVSFTLNLESDLNLETILYFIMMWSNDSSCWINDMRWSEGLVWYWSTVYHVSTTGDSNLNLMIWDEVCVWYTTHYCLKSEPVGFTQWHRVVITKAHWPGYRHLLHKTTWGHATHVCHPARPEMMYL
jgi:hypothetical protein